MIKKLINYSRKMQNEKIVFDEINEDEFRNCLSTVSFGNAYDLLNYMKNNKIEKYYFSYKKNCYRAFKLISDKNEIFLRVYWRKKWYDIFL